MAKGDRQTYIEWGHLETILRQGYVGAKDMADPAYAAPVDEVMNRILALCKKEREKGVPGAELDSAVVVKIAESVMVEFHAESLTHKLEPAFSDPQELEAFVRRVIKGIEAGLRRNKGGRARAEKTLTRNERIVLLKGKGMTYPQIAFILSEGGENISADAVRKVCERHSKK